MLLDTLERFLDATKNKLQLPLNTTGQALGFSKGTFVATPIVAEIGLAFDDDELQSQKTFQETYSPGPLVIIDARDFTSHEYDGTLWTQKDTTLASLKTQRILVDGGVLFDPLFQRFFLLHSERGLESLL